MRRFLRLRGTGVHQDRSCQRRGFVVPRFLWVECPVMFGCPLAVVAHLGSMVRHPPEVLWMTATLVVGL